MKIAFMAPEGKGGPYYMYKDILDYFTIHHAQQIQIDFFSTKKDWILLHIKRYDIILSTIPFLFHPLGTKKFIFNLHGNYKIERKQNRIGLKLLYLVEWNFLFCNKILVTSDFLPNKLGFGQFYKKKIVKIPLHVNLLEKIYSKNENIALNKTIKFLTISSFEFLEKAYGIIDIARQLKDIKGYNIFWTIIAGGNKDHKKIIEEELINLDLGDRIQVDWIEHVSYEDLKTYYQNSDIYLYGTRLETWGKTIMEAMSFGLPVILLEYELWKYIYPKEIITDNIPLLFEKIIKDYKYYSDLSILFVKKYGIKKVMVQYYDLFLEK